MAQIENDGDGTTGGARHEVARVFDQARSERRGECFIEETVYDGDFCPRPSESPAGRDPSEEVKVEKKKCNCFLSPRQHHEHSGSARRTLTSVQRRGPALSHGQRGRVQMGHHRAASRFVSGRKNKAP